MAKNQGQGVIDLFVTGPFYTDEDSEEISLTLVDDDVADEATFKYLAKLFRKPSEVLALISSNRGIQRLFRSWCSYWSTVCRDAAAMVHEDSDDEDF